MTYSPQTVENFSDIQRILKKYSISSFGNKRNLLKVLNIIQPDERLYFITPTNIKIKESNDSDVLSSPGVIFISERRVVYQQLQSDPENFIEFDLQEVHFVGAIGNGITGGYISFCTSKKKIDFLVSYKREIYEKIREVFIYAILNAGENITSKADVDFSKEKNPEKLSIVGMTTIKTKKVVECKGCGATVIADITDVIKCEYCGRYVD